MDGTQDPSQLTESMNDDVMDDNNDDDYDDMFDDEVDWGTLEEAEHSSNAVLNTGDIAAMRDREVARLCDILDITADRALALLKQNRWDFDKTVLLTTESDVLGDTETGEHAHEASVTSAESAAPPSAADPKGKRKRAPATECAICGGEDILVTNTTSLQCGHVFCNECWTQYIETKINEGQASLIPCMAYKCSAVVEEGTVRSLVSAACFARYTGFMKDAYVDDNPNVRWCPAPGCQFAVRPSAGHYGEALCRCGHRFCFRCGQESHVPASCGDYENWRIKCQDDSETFNWLKSHTQDCPKCKSPIQKNGGCNHMTCQRPGCGHQFCWVCLGDWKGHSACNRFKAKEQAKSTARAELDRYLHYYTRYAVHEQSLAVQAETLAKAEEKMQSLVQESESWIDCRFVLQAATQVCACRRALKYTYAMGYYMASGPEKDLFEYLQESLERTTEELSAELEKEVTLFDRIEIVNMTNLARRRLKNLLEGLEEGLTLAR